MYIDYSTGLIISFIFLFSSCNRRILLRISLISERISIFSSLYLIVSGTTLLLVSSSNGILHIILREYGNKLILPWLSPWMSPIIEILLSGVLLSGVLSCSLLFFVEDVAHCLVICN